MGIEFVILSRINLGKLSWILLPHLLSGLATAQFSWRLIVIYFSIQLSSLRKLLIFDRFSLLLPSLPQEESEETQARYAKRDP